MRGTRVLAKQNQLDTKTSIGINMPDYKSLGNDNCKKVANYLAFEPEYQVNLRRGYLVLC